MSKTLRRPMFRGGPINSEGTGITSGLNHPRQHYADGPDDQGVQPYYNELGIFNADNNYMPAVIDSTVTSDQSPLAGRGQKILNNLKASNISSNDIPSKDEFMNDVFMRTIYGDDYDSQDTSNVSKSGMQKRLEKIKANAPTPTSVINQKLLEQGVIDKNSSIKDIISAQNEFRANEKKLKDQIPDYSKSNVLTDVYDLYNKPVGTKQTVDEDVQFDKFYNKALEKLGGGDKANRQAIFDAMLAASPGFFKGRTLTEAAPHVLEGIIKSGALDRPQKIQQAAAEIALNRQIGLEKIQEQEKARAALLNQKLTGPQTIQNDIAKIQANLKTGPNPLTITGLAPTAIKGVSLSELDKNPEASSYIDKQEKGKLILVQDPNGTQHYIVVTRKDKNNKSTWSYVGQKGIGQTASSPSSSDLAAYNNYRFTE
jgi:hypothetical protein